MNVAIYASDKKLRSLVMNNTATDALKILRHEMSNYDNLLKGGHDREEVRTEFVTQLAARLIQLNLIKR